MRIISYHILSWELLQITHTKSTQLMRGIWSVTTPIVALSDDDAVWSDNFLDWALAPFDDPQMGGVGSKQEMMPVKTSKLTAWE